MSSPQASKRKGREAETRVVDYLISRGYVHAERRRLAGVQDRGDIAGLPGLTIEIKAGKQIDLAGWLKQLDTEQANTGDPTGLLVVKRRGHTNPANWYAVQTLGSWLDLYTELDGITARE